ncbi:hypothetical protein VHA01S_030_00440 [Vibrio halioticoli NBRC 102217]|uniref:N-acetyltransferase domain-containing protein n=1 Tax=Vibrio halioticoli NBRC 102217 TaxID=1219072 RepID=V5F433_9VIBR|nr:hypothetical protein [Vibrio halioticoli]GAD89969.1 hypothetical protein VHA01S_030_00440 [Vibrio halioticoli NBRC 102217]
MNNQVISNRYQQIRLAALAQTQRDTEQFEPDFIGHIDLTEINEDALCSQDRWEMPLNRQIGWDWRRVRNQYRRDHIARLELAVWYDNELCGLMIGKASDGKLVVKISYIQGGQAENPLKGFIVPIASRCAELFAVAVEADWIGIQDPIDDEDLLNYYRELGFNERDPFDPRNNALFKRVTIVED